LKLDLDLMRQYDIGGGKRSIHSLQNHDELYIHFSYDAQNPNQTFTVALPQYFLICIVYL